jgi:hypothetical protein
VGASSCVYFSKLEEFPRLSAVIRSDPRLLTYIETCGGHNGHIVSSVHPDHVVFYDHDLGTEAIDQDASEANAKVDQLAQRIEDGKKASASVRDLLTRAQALTNTLIACAAGTQSQSVAQQLLQLLADASASASAST